MAGIDYKGWLDNGSGTSSGITKALPFSNESSPWWNPGESEWLFGGGATKGMNTAPQTGDYQRGYLQQMTGREAPQMNTGASDQARGQQQQLAQMLFAQANGQKQGAGELAVQRQVNNAQANNTSAAQMSRGANTAMAMRNAARTNADIGVNGAGQAGIAQLQDQQMATNQLGGLLGATRGQDIQVAGANQAGQMQQQQIQLAALAQMLGVDQAALTQDLEKRKIDATDKGTFGSLLQAGGSLMAACDENLKTEVEYAGDEIDSMLREIVPCSYSYEDSEKYGEGRRVGVMAQDLQNTAAGASIIMEVDDHLEIDCAKAVPLLLATVARLEKRIRMLEGK